MATWFPCGRGRTLFILRSLRSKVKITITINRIFDNMVVSTSLVLYIGSLLNLTTWLPCGRGRTLFILGSKVKVSFTINRIVYCLIIYIDVHILWCTHFLFWLAKMLWCCFSITSSVWHIKIIDDFNLW